MGHAAGDALLRRVGEVLNAVVEKPFHAARIGGDEFVVLMPSSDQRDGLAMMENIEKLVEVNNQFYSNMTLSVSMGAATSHGRERLEEVAKRADLRMLEAKRDFYTAVNRDRRRTGSAVATGVLSVSP